MVCMGWWIAGCSLWCTVDTTFSCVLVCSSWFILRWDEQANVLYICDFPKFGWAPCVYGILWTTIRSELWWLLCGQQRSCCAASRTLVSGKNASWTTGWRIRRRNRWVFRKGWAVFRKGLAQVKDLEVPTLAVSHPSGARRKVYQDESLVKELHAFLEAHGPDVPNVP